MQARSGNSEKLRKTLDVFEYWLLRFRAFGHVRLQPPAAGRKQLSGLGDAVGRNDEAAAYRYHTRIRLIARQHFDTNPSISDAVDREAVEERPYGKPSRLRIAKTP